MENLGGIILKDRFIDKSLLIAGAKGIYGDAFWGGFLWYE
jgi:hypothetical protein